MECRVGTLLWQCHYIRSYGFILFDMLFADVGFAGTPGYLSPEVLRKDPYGKPVDIWACGE
jgi:serine/threonine protein kinase